MARARRQDFAGAIHHVSIRGIDEESLYPREGDQQVFLAMLSQTVQRQAWVVYAYCLMTTHYHLLVRTLRPTLSSGMHQLNGTYASRANRLESRRGHLFSGRYRATLVNTDRHLLESCRYIVLNPVRAGMVAEPEEWPWSSYRSTIGLEPGPGFFDTSVPRRLLGGDTADGAELFRRFVADAPDRGR